MIGFSLGATPRLRPLALLFLGTLVSGTPAFSQSTTAPATSRTYTIPNGSRYDAANMVLAADGTIWTASASTTENAVVSLSPDGKKAIRWTFPVDAAPSYLLPEPDGTFWVAELGGFKLTRFNPSTNEIERYSDAARRATGIIRRADGKLWVPETNGVLTLFDPATGTFTYYKSDSLIHLSYPYKDPDGTLWMADFGTGKAGIVRVAADGSKAWKWELPDPFGSPTKVIRGFDGAIWVSVYDLASLVRLDPQTNELKTFIISETTLPYDLQNYKDRIVYSEQSLGSIGFFDPKGARPSETKTNTPTEITFETETVTVIPTKEKTTKLELDVSTAAPEPVSGVIGDSHIEYLAGSTYSWAIVVDEPRGRILFATIGGIRELLPPLASPGDVFFPSAASISGVGGVRWQTDLFVWNRGTADTSGATKSIDVTERVQPSGWIAGLIAQATVPVAAGAIRLQEDVVATDMGFPDLFGGLRLSPGANGSDLFAGARVYRKREDGGTFGFYRNGLRASQVFLVEEPGFLITPADVSSERTNAGMYMVQAAKGEMTIVDSEGTTRARHAFSWPEGYHVQFSSVFSQLGLPPLPNARIVFSLTSGSILPYGIAIDNSTNDPADLPFLKSGDRAFGLRVPGAFHRTGPLGDEARTDLQLFSAAGAATVSAYFRPALAAGDPGSGVEVGPVVIEVPEKAVVNVTDILRQFVGDTPAAGEIELSANQPIYAVSRVSAPDQDSGRYGFTLAGQVPESAIPSGSRAVFIAATDSGWDVFQSDLHLTNPSGDPIEVTVRATSYEGKPAGEKTIQIGPQETRILEAAFYSVSGFGAPVGRLDIFSSAGSPFHALLLRGDRKTGDTDAILPLLMTR